MAPPPKRKHGKKTLAEHMANIDCDDSSFVKLEMRHEPKLTREAIEPLIDMAFSPKAVSANWQIRHGRGILQRHPNLLGGFKEQGEGTE